MRICAPGRNAISGWAEESAKKARRGESTQTQVNGRPYNTFLVAALIAESSSCGGVSFFRRFAPKKENSAINVSYAGHISTKMDPNANPPEESPW